MLTLEGDYGCIIGFGRTILIVWPQTYYSMKSLIGRFCRRYSLVHISRLHLVFRIMAWKVTVISVFSIQRFWRIIVDEN